MASTIEQINLRRKDMKAPQGGSAVVGRASGSSGGGSGNMGHGRRISFSSSVASPPPKADKLGPDKIDTSNDARIKAVLKKYLATLAKEHAYIATRALRAARLDINNRAAQREKEASMPGYVKSKKGTL